MKNFYFIFGASSHIAKLLIKSKLPNIIGFSQKRKVCNNKNIFFINYEKKDFLKIINRNIKNFKPVFIFANGISDKKIFLNMNKKELDKIIYVNQKIPIYITQKILAKFIHKKPSFIFLSSSRGFLGDKGISIYSATKNALEGFVRSMSMEYGKLNIIFRVIRIGLFNGGLINQIKNKKVKKILDRTSNNDYVEFDSFLKLVDFIASDVTGNGSYISCDNGFF